MTPAALRVLDGLRKATVDNLPASVRFLAGFTGHKSPATVQWHLERLEAEGFAVRVRGGWLPNEPTGTILVSAASALVTEEVSNV